MKFPRLCIHKRTNRAYATDPATGKQIQFGLSGKPATTEAYNRWIASMAARRAEVPSGLPPGSILSLAELIADYTAFAKRYYVKRGKVTSELKMIEANSSILLDLFAVTRAADFGPNELKAVRQAYIVKDWNLATINNQMCRLKRMFRWGVEHELIKPEQLVSLCAVRGLSPGRCEARVSDPILPVPADDVRAAAAKCKPVVRAMLLVHLLTGMRTGELCDLLASRIDQSREPWLYVPLTHKNEHHGKERPIYLGPEARAILTPWIEKANGGRLWLTRDRGPFTPNIYSANIERACKRAGVPRFRPLQIRHTAGTIFRREAGIEGAQALLGHAHLKTSEIYAENRSDLARITIEKIG